MQTVKVNNDVEIPILGFGVFQIADPAECERSVVDAIQTGYSHIDTVLLIRTKKRLAGSTSASAVPRWATRGFFVSINGRAQAVKAEPGSYLTLRRTLQADDTIDVRIPFHFYLVPVMDQPNVASVFYGPVLLAAEESAPRSDRRPITLLATARNTYVSGGRRRWREVPLPDAVPAPTGAATEDLVNLGRMLYFEPRLSKTPEDLVQHLPRPGEVRRGRRADIRWPQGPEGRPELTARLFGQEADKKADSRDSVIWHLEAGAAYHSHREVKKHL